MLAGENLAMCIGRQGHVVGTGEWNLIYCSQRIEDFNLFLPRWNVNFPLYIYPSSDLFAQNESAERKPNLNPELVTALAKAHDKKPSPEAIFHYVYAVLHAPAYRNKYAQFLRADFPRIPFTADKDLFDKLAGLGSRLSPYISSSHRNSIRQPCRFDGEGDAMVARTKAQGFRFDPAEQRMHVNRTQYFSPLSPEVYQYRIGGYQVCEKWLKDRKERRLHTTDIRTYCRMATAIERTITIQQQLDIAYVGLEDNYVSLKE